LFGDDRNCVRRLQKAISFLSKTSSASPAWQKSTRKRLIILTGVEAVSYTAKLVKFIFPNDRLGHTIAFNETDRML